MNVLIQRHWPGRTRLPPRRNPLVRNLDSRNKYYTIIHINRLRRTFITSPCGVSTSFCSSLSKHAIDPSKFAELGFSFPQCCHVFKIQLDLRRTSLMQDQLRGVALCSTHSIFFKPLATSDTSSIHNIISRLYDSDGWKLYRALPAPCGTEGRALNICETLDGSSI
jgi:hypothetical protein